LTSHSRSVRFSVNRPKVYDRLSEDDVVGALRRMHRIRRFEEAAEDSYIRGLSYGTMHLSIGQEATAVARSIAIDIAYWLFSQTKMTGSFQIEARLSAS
jgi:TPP-dependent pyruvate/acetoin dehydrogenase alpha subunit